MWYVSYFKIQISFGNKVLINFYKKQKKAKSSLLEEINLDDQKSDLLRSGGHEGILYDALDACLLAGMY